VQSEPAVSDELVSAALKNLSRSASRRVTSSNFLRRPRSRSEWHARLDVELKIVAVQSFCFLCAMTVADYLNDLGTRYPSSDVQLDVGGNKYSATDLVDGLSESDKNRPVAIETGTAGCFIRDAVTEQRLFQVVWSPNREGWHVPNRDIGAHYYVTANFYLASLCGDVTTMLDSELIESLPDSVAPCKKCLNRKQVRSEKGNAAPESPNVGSVPLPTFTFSFSSTPLEVKRGLPVYEAEIRGEKLERRDMIVSRGDDQLKLSIDAVRDQHRAGLLPAELPVLVTTYRCETTYYCGEGTVGSVVAAWESAPLDNFDKQDVSRMIHEFSFPEYEVTSKAQYSDLKKLYARCDNYYRYIAARDKDFKRLTKAAAKDLLLSLDDADATWDSTDGEKRFADELRKRHPELIRTEVEKKRKREKEKEALLQRESRRPLIETRNNLTNFPHKDMPIEVKDIGTVTIRELKPKIRDGLISPETLVRYRQDAEWAELSEFLNDWMRRKATIKQIDYLQALQRQHGIASDIPLDISREEISTRISALAPQQDY